MSLPAQLWVNSVQVGNTIAKALLRFLAEQNFNNDGFIFKNATYARQIEVNERSIIRALKLLEEKNFIRIKERFDNTGKQISNQIFLNIPVEFLNKYHDSLSGINMVEGDKLSSTGVTSSHSPRVTECRPYNNKYNNNKFNYKEQEVSKNRSPLSLFEPDQKNILLCQRLGLSLEEELKSFSNRHKGEKNQYEFERWIKASKDYCDKKYSNNSKNRYEPKSTVPEYGPGHETWEFMQGLKRQKLVNMN